MNDRPRQKTFYLNSKGENLVGCTACFWWTLMKGQDVSSATQEFEAHTCAEHAALKTSPETQGLS